MTAETFKLLESYYKDYPECKPSEGVASLFQIKERLDKENIGFEMIFNNNQLEIKIKK